MSSMNAAHSSDHHGPYQGRGIIGFAKRWLFTTNHKDIGTLYLWLSVFSFFVAGAMALIMRIELYAPGHRFIDPNFYNQMTTLHGLIMLFGVVMPAFTGMANWQIPMMIGAPDMALPRLNNLSFWLLPFAFMLLGSTMFHAGGGPNFGWTMYAPLSTKYAPPSTDFMIFAIHMMGISSIMGSINIIATILNLRAPGMTMMRMAYFCLDLAYYRLFIDSHYAGVGRCGDHDVSRQAFWNQFL